MDIAPSIKKRSPVLQALPADDLEVCPRCKNQYIIIRMKTGRDFNDFGDRYCPFCGLLTEVFRFPVKE